MQDVFNPQRFLDFFATLEFEIDIWENQLDICSGNMLLQPFGGTAERGPGNSVEGSGRCSLQQMATVSTEMCTYEDDVHATQRFHFRSKSM